MTIKIKVKIKHLEIKRLLLKIQVQQDLQQQVQQMSNNRMMAQREGRGRRYWSEKSVRPMKFEYEFQANPLFREKIQNEQVQDSQRRTKLEQQYLQEVMR